MKLHNKSFYVSEKATAKKISSAQDVYENLKDIGNADQETFWVIGYTAGNIEVYRECVFIGGINSATIDPKIIFKRLLINDCSRFIISHNHPGGEVMPSEADLYITRKLVLGGELLGIMLFDHIIIGQDKYFSFSEKGLL